MSKSDVFNHAWIDLVFEGRNQKYGAYQLRRQQGRTTMIALFSGIALMGLAAGIPAAINYFSDTPQQTAGVIADPEGIKVTEFEIPKTPDVPVAKPEPEVPQKTAAPAPSATNTVKFTNTLVATNQPVPDPPHTDDFDNANPGPETIQGVTGGSTTTVTSGVIGSTGENPEALNTGNEIVIVAAVDEIPVYPGGMERFYSEVGRKYRIPETDKEITLKVYVSFVIEKDGSMTNVKVLRDPGMGLGKEALRVLESIKTKWKPGKVKGKPVRTSYNLPITVNVK